MAVQSPEPILNIWERWREKQHLLLLLCRMQQRFEKRMICEKNGAEDKPCASTRFGQSLLASGLSAADAYVISREAEIQAMDETLGIPNEMLNTRAQTLFGVVAKLEMIVATQEIEDQMAFPWPYISSALGDLKSIVGDPPRSARNRHTIRASVKSRWNDAIRIVSDFKESH